MKIGLDVFGGDFAPVETIKGAILAREALQPPDRVVLIGKKEIILSLLEEYHADPSGFDIVHAPDVIEMGESPTKAFNQKPHSSIAEGFRLLKHKEIDAFASAGSSGAMLVGCVYVVNTIPGIIRPSALTFIPKENGGLSLLIDVGINPDAKADVLYQFGILGSLYAKYIQHIAKPNVGLLNIGTEEKKGNLVTQSVYQLMKGTRDFHFVGNVESRDLFKDSVHVFVCDGFIGNIILKQSEAIYRVLAKRGIRDSYLERFNYELYGGSPILGINETVVVGHGISNAVAIKNMILLTRDVHQAGLTEKIRQALRKFAADN
ncbi:MAG: phosphate acyltransferase PlsX [Bacteroidetes bacterium]|nr:phosphate acyltransferase PlsX [Bacteroidota bacterium]